NHRPTDPSQSWKTFLHNHLAGTAAYDFLVVPTVSVIVTSTMLWFGGHKRDLSATGERVGAVVSLCRGPANARHRRSHHQRRSV
ncbi:MAG: hypothetical protein ACI841_003144, partial [Planctomycetota bacterium]